jgi:RND family efflux transporter MFP subunit
MKKNIVLLILFLLGGCSSKKEEVSQEKKGIPVTVVHPCLKDVSFYVESIGVLRPKVYAEIFSEIDGHITEICVKEGQYVTKGTPLFSIDEKLHEIHVQEALAELGMEKAQFQALEKKSIRYNSLVKKDLIAKTEWEEIESQLERAKNSVALHEAKVRKAKIELDWCTITSPIDGRIGKIDTSIGLCVRSKETLLTSITQVQSLVVECSITEKEYFQIAHKTASMEVSPLSYPEIIKNGTITFLDTSFSENQGALFVKGVIVNEDDSLISGQVVRVRIPFKTEKGVILIPGRSIRYNQQGPYVYTLQPDMTVEACQLVLGAEQGDDRIVLKGLSVETSVIVDGHARVSAGSKVIPS